MNPDEFNKILEQIPGLDVKRAASQFQFYYDELIKTNQQYNLTRITGVREAYLKHFYDSIIPVLKLNFPLLEPGMRLCDVGTGAGLPGLPLKIIYPEVKLSLLDSSQKKLQFSKKLTEQLNLKDVDFIWQRAEDFGRGEGREKYDLVVSRAVANLRALSEYSLPLVKNQGYFLAYKGRNGVKELKEAADLIPVLGGQVRQTLTVNLLPGDEARSLFLIQKVKPTPQKYPRANKQIKADMKESHAK